MIGAIILIVILYLITRQLFSNLHLRRRWFPQGMMSTLFWFHYIMLAVYYIYAVNNASDSFMYYERTRTFYNSWMESFETGTHFIDFVAYPFVHYFSFTYEMMMVLFAWMGYWGFIWFYLFFRENVKYRHTFMGYDLLTIFIFLPNMHFWTTSFGKGSIIFMGIAMVAYGMSKIQARKWLLITGLALVYFIRPHVFLFLCSGLVAGFVTGRAKISMFQKVMVLGAGVVAMILLYDKILSFANLDSENTIESFTSFASNRAHELSKSAKSGIDISNYPFIFKLFTFWFRPLFIDSPGLLGVIVSFENLFYLVMTFKLLQRNFLRFIWNSPFVVKAAGVMFLLGSAALALAMSNMGIIMRQKSMVMYFLLFIVIMYMDYQKIMSARSANLHKMKLAGR